MSTPLQDNYFRDLEKIREKYLQMAAVLANAAIIQNGNHRLAKMIITTRY